MLSLTTREGNEIYCFNSVAEASSYIIPDAFDTVVKLQNEDFIGRKFSSFEDVQAACKQFWGEGMETMAKFVSDLEQAGLPEIKSVKARKTYSETDGELDFERMMAGNPEMFIRVESEKSNQPIDVTVVIDTVASGYVSAKNILWRGAAAIALVKLLEDRGYRTEIWAVSSSTIFRDNNRAAITAVCLKRPGEVLDQSTLINTVSGWFFRTETFSLFASICLKTRRAIHPGLGCPYTPTETDLDLFVVDQKRVYSSGVFSYNGALGLMVANLNKLASEE